MGIVEQGTLVDENLSKRLDEFCEIHGIKERHIESESEIKPEFCVSERGCIYCKDGFGKWLAIRCTA